MIKKINNLKTIKSNTLWNFYNLINLSCSFWYTQKDKTKWNKTKAVNNFLFLPYTLGHNITFYLIKTVLELGFGPLGIRIRQKWFYPSIFPYLSCFSSCKVSLWLWQNLWNISEHRSTAFCLVADLIICCVLCLAILP